MLQDEQFIAVCEDIFGNWDDDAEIVQLLLYSTLEKPSKQNFDLIVSEDKYEFAKDLLEAAINKRKYLDELIAPKLRGWDASRVAILDSILLRMALCEFLYF